MDKVEEILGGFADEAKAVANEEPASPGPYAQTVMLARCMVKLLGKVEALETEIARIAALETTQTQ